MAAGCGLRSTRPRPSLTWAAARQPAESKTRSRDTAQHRGLDFSICAGWPETPPRRSDVSSSATSARLLRFLQLPASGLSHQVLATWVLAAATAVSPLDSVASFWRGQRSWLNCLTGHGSRNAHWVPFAGWWSRGSLPNAASGPGAEAGRAPPCVYVEVSKLKMGPGWSCP